MGNTPEASIREQRARLGGLALSATQDPHVYTARARRAFLDRFEDAVDPLRELPEGERERRATAARRLYFARLALRSAKARARRRSKPERKAA